MIKNVTKIASATLIAGMVLAGVTACSGNTAPAPEKTTASSEPIPTFTSEADVTPLNEDLTSLNGKTINLTKMDPSKPETLNTSTIVLNSADPSQWTAQFAPAEAQGTIISYFQGEIKEGIASPSGIAAVTPGTATVTLTNSATGEIVTFTVVVK